MDFSQFKSLIIEINESNESIVTISLNRPKALNALNKELITELDSIINILEKDNNIKVIIITGSGDRAFAAGADIEEMSLLNPDDGKAWGAMGSMVFRKIEKSKKIYISAINGYALGGGCELAMACDIRIGSHNIKMGLPETGLGIIPGYGGTQRMQRIIGMGKAKELIFTCDLIDAQEALRIGLINHVVESEVLLEKSYEIAKKIIKNSFNAVMLAKEAINIGNQVDIDSGIKIEQNLFGLCFAHNDQKEGMNAFLEKRKAKY
ncbi:enoyl-CoA hydratase-related protein [Fusobacterium sp. PH5-44]|uniref:enoyl-CoA hydratase-related protein n=1 Tax=unclassified Fusobacterium TaxID=2648384 RepID=UPI003D1F6D01